MNKSSVWFFTILGLFVLLAGLAHNQRPGQKLSEYYFNENEKIGYSADGRKWVVQKISGEYSRVWQIKPDGELLWAPPKSPQRFMTCFKSFNGDGFNMTVADDSQIMAMIDSVVINFSKAR